MTPRGFPFQHGHQPESYYIQGNWDSKLFASKYHPQNLWNCLSVRFAKEPPPSGAAGGGSLQSGASASPDFWQTRLAPRTHHLRWVVLVHVTPHCILGLLVVVTLEMHGHAFWTFLIAAEETDADSLVQLGWLQQHAVVLCHFLTNRIENSVSNTNLSDRCDVLVNWTAMFCDFAPLWSSRVPRFELSVVRIGFDAPSLFCFFCVQTLDKQSFLSAVEMRHFSVDKVVPNQFPSVQSNFSQSEHKYLAFLDKSEQGVESVFCHASVYHPFSFDPHVPLARLSFASLKLIMESWPLFGIVNKTGAPGQPEMTVLRASAGEKCWEVNSKSIIIETNNLNVWPLALDTSIWENNPQAWIFNSDWLDCNASNDVTRFVLSPFSWLWIFEAN